MINTITGMLLLCTFTLALLAIPIPSPNLSVHVERLLSLIMAGILFTIFALMSNKLGAYIWGLIL